MKRIASRITERLTFSIAIALVGVATLLGIIILFVARPAERSVRTWLRRLSRR